MAVRTASPSKYVRTRVCANGAQTFAGATVAGLEASATMLHRRSGAPTTSGSVMAPAIAIVITAIRQRAPGRAATITTGNATSAHCLVANASPRSTAAAIGRRRAASTAPTHSAVVSSSSGWPWRTALTVAGLISIAPAAISRVVRERP